MAIDDLLQFSTGQIQVTPAVCKLWAILSLQVYTHRLKPAAYALLAVKLSKTILPLIPLFAITQCFVRRKIIYCEGN